MGRTFTEWIRYFMANPYPNFDYATYVDLNKVKGIISKIMIPFRESVNGNTKQYNLWYIYGLLQFIEIVDAVSNKRGYYSDQWVKMPFRTKDHPNPMDFPKPTNLQIMTDKGNQLAALTGNIPFVRVDIYNRQTKTCCRTINDLFFKEYNFAPDSGTNPFTPNEYEIIYGNKISAGL
jgi:hypothetical protein